MSAVRKPQDKRTGKKNALQGKGNWTPKQIATAKNATKVARHTARKADNIAKAIKKYGPNHGSITPSKKEMKDQKIANPRKKVITKTVQVSVAEAITKKVPAETMAVVKLENRVKMKAKDRRHEYKARKQA